jgi:hypothetical protein
VYTVRARHAATLLSKGNVLLVRASARPAARRFSTLRPVLSLALDRAAPGRLSVACSALLPA